MSLTVFVWRSPHQQRSRNHWCYRHGQLKVLGILRDPHSRSLPNRYPLRPQHQSGSYVHFRDRPTHPEGRLGHGASLVGGIDGGRREDDTCLSGFVVCHCGGRKGRDKARWVLHGWPVLMRGLYCQVMLKWLVACRHLNWLHC